MLEGYLGTEKSKKAGSNNAAQYAQNDHRSKTECQQIGYQNLGPKTYYATLSGVALPVVQAVEDNAEVVDVELDSSVDLADFSENLN
jgi:hypothetical protein